MGLARNACAARDVATGRPFDALEFRSASLDWSRPYVMGVINLTPDSFSDGGRFQGLDAALDQANRMAAAGADILDVGGESTRPGASPVDHEEECRRVLPLVEALASRVALPISIDTTKSVVARRAVDAGAELVNDISGGLFDPSMIETLAEMSAAFVCGHVRGQTVAETHACVPPSYDEVLAELRARVAAFPSTLRRRTIADPCIGFGKGLQTNLELLRRAGELGCAVERPILVGPSRKRFLGEITGLPVDDRDAATVGACLASVQAGAHILRVHDVAMTVSALQVFCATHEVGP